MYDRHETEQAATAEMYARAELAVFPVWWITERRCACPRGLLPETDPRYCGVTSTGEAKGSPGKHPMTRNGVKAATLDISQINQWWNAAPQANIGMAASANNLAIIDVDPKHGGDASLTKLLTYATKHGHDLMDTMSARTGSGGLHLIFTAPTGAHSGSCTDDAANGQGTGCIGCIRNGQGNKPPFGANMPGLDTRGYGGYIVAPPSTHYSGGTYEWIYFVKDAAPWPLLLSRVIEAAYKTAPVSAARPQPRGDINRYAQAALDREIERLRATGEGGRNAQLNTAAFSLGQLVGAGVLTRHHVEAELAAAAVSIGLTAVETRATIRSGLDKGASQPRNLPARTAAA